ncbi:MAG: DNA polymerase III subunit alpha, partial [Candidatus Muiribacteriaceae bacterium]
MISRSYAHLHVNSCYSIGRSVLRVQDIIRRAKELGYFSIALTDIDNLYGAVDFYFSCIENGLKPIIGVELGLSEGFFTILVKNTTGFHNLIYLTNLVNTDKADIEDLYENREGLYIFSGSKNSTVYDLMSRDQISELEDFLRKMSSRFGDSFFVELDASCGDNIRGYMHILEGVAENIGVGTVLTNRCLYTKPEHYRVLDAYNCIVKGLDYYSHEREKIEYDGNFIRSPEDMKELGFESAFSNTEKIARRCNLELEREPRIPGYKIPEGFRDSSGYLRYLTSHELEKKYSHDIMEKARKRLNHELTIIDELGYSDYFLIVWDIVRYARENTVTIGPGRGSAVSSLVSYLLNITDIDPIRHDLIFERFINPGRKELPDIDIDVASERREVLLRYVREHFGQDKVASIISFGKFKAALALREVSKLLQINERVVSNMMSVLDKRLSIEDNLTRNSRFADFTKRSSDARKAVSGAKKFQGLIRNTSQHAAGIIIYPADMFRQVAIGRSDDRYITHWDKESLERLGILKFDLLSLRTLSMIDNIMRRIKKKGVEPDQNDEKVYSMISEGRTTGIFQFETPTMTRAAMLLRPQNFEELCILTSVVRPGARDSLELIMSNREKGKWDSGLKRLQKILAPTYGVIIYQEQIMAIAIEIAGFSLEEADSFRQAISKKRHSIMQGVREKFIEGAHHNHVGKDKAERIFEDIRKFAGYGFNKSHAVAYTSLSFRCAWLKANFPFKFYTELLNSDIDSMDKVNSIVKEMREQGVKILPPHLLKSRARFIGGTKGIRFAFSGIKGIGFTNAKLLEAFIKKTGKRFGSYDEFVF